MKEATKRSIFRWIHIISGIPIIGYIYDSPSDTPNYAFAIRYFILPGAAAFGIVDVERPCRSTTVFEKIRRDSYENGKGIGGIGIHESIATY